MWEESKKLLLALATATRAQFDNVDSEITKHSFDNISSVIEF
jgi:hypothetical protein